MLVAAGDATEEITRGFGVFAPKGDEPGEARKARELASSGLGCTDKGEASDEPRACGDTACFAIFWLGRSALAAGNRRGDAVLLMAFAAGDGVETGDVTFGAALSCFVMAFNVRAARTRPAVTKEANIIER